MFPLILTALNRDLGMTIGSTILPIRHCYYKGGTSQLRVSNLGFMF